LGLRGSEVCGLALGDVSWRRGEIIIHGKGPRVDTLPLPHDIGCAIVAYLQRGRPHFSSRFIFLRDHAPYRELTRHAVSNVVRHACDRSGFPRVSSHRLRHTAASRMLLAGAPLADIAEVLRHRDVATTAIYAKVDRNALREVAQPWPGGAL
jgi:site-specific recombinase XerD